MISVILSSPTVQHKGFQRIKPYNQKYNVTINGVQRHGKRKNMTTVKIYKWTIIIF